MEQDFDSLHPDDQEQLQSILEKDSATRWSSSLPVVELKQQRQCTEAYPLLLWHTCQSFDVDWILSIKWKWTPGDILVSLDHIIVTEQLTGLEIW